MKMPIVRLDPAVKLPNVNGRRYNANGACSRVRVNRGCDRRNDSESPNQYQYHAGQVLHLSITDILSGSLHHGFIEGKLVKYLRASETHGRVHDNKVQF